MDWPAWQPTYDAICADFGFDPVADAAARDDLDARLSTHWQADLDALLAALRGRDVVIVGPALADASWPERLPADAPVLVSDDAVHHVMPVLRPLAIVTDLDGDLPAHAAASALEVPLFVHAHGDNGDVIAGHLDHLRGPLLGTTQVEPRGRVHNFGGFTDGDRAACLAAHAGAARLTLVGFDFDAPVAKPGRDAATKARKLAWAQRIIAGLGVPVRRL